MNCRAFPDALSAFAKQKTCCLSRNQKQGARRGAKGLAIGGLSQRGRTENSGPPNCYSYAVPNVTPWVTLSLGEALKRSSLTGSTLLSTPCRRPKSSNLLL